MHTYTHGRIADYNPANVRPRSYKSDDEGDDSSYDREEEITADDDFATEDDLPFPYVE